MRYRVRHTTTYSYRESVAVSHNLVHLVPLDSSRQRCLRHELTVSPSPATAHERRDYYGNRTGTFTVQQPHRELVVERQRRIAHQRRRGAARGERSGGACHGSWDQRRMRRLQDSAKAGWGGFPRASQRLVGSRQASTRSPLTCLNSR